MYALVCLKPYSYLHMFRIHYFFLLAIIKNKLARPRRKQMVLLLDCICRAIAYENRQPGDHNLLTLTGRHKSRQVITLVKIVQDDYILSPGISRNNQYLQMMVGIWNVTDAKPLWFLKIIKVLVKLKFSLFISKNKRQNKYIVLHIIVRHLVLWYWYSYHIIVQIFDQYVN